MEDQTAKGISGIVLQVAKFIKSRLHTGNRLELNPHHPRVEIQGIAQTACAI
jgi:hypothetical protein